MVRILALMLVVLIGAIQSQATPYWTEEQIEAARSEFQSLPRNEETGTRAGLSSLDDIPYFVKYRQLCDFLDGLQVTTPGANFGGMREGEVGNDYSIIQTDNTQEAIRIWSQYAIWTGDTARYSENIRRAWVYNSVWPAWREEGGGYYAMHNCGWGFEAVAKFREAYGDTSMNWYADSCALWVVGHTLGYNENGTTPNELEPCAEGLGIGGLYPHSLYRDRTDWQDHAIFQGRRLRRWFEARPDRLNNNLNWALCGGTALWGVCQTVFLAYPDSGASWLNQYGQQLETWENPSQWYNAFNTWYSNATFRCFEITGDSLYWNRGVFYADSLLGFDVDDDGGIPPGTCCISNGNDHSWVSAYMGWMGMERIITSGPIILAASLGIVLPDTSRPLLELDTTNVVTRVANLGTDTIVIYSSLYSPVSFGADTQFTMPPGDVRDIAWPVEWRLPLASLLPGDSLWMQIILDYWAADMTGDTVTEETFAGFDLRRRSGVFGSITGQHDSEAVPCHIDFYAEDYPDSIWTSVDVAAGEQYTNGQRPLLEGNNRMVITPPPRYMAVEQPFVTIGNPNPDPLDIWLTSSDVLLVDDDEGEDYETWVLSSMEENGWNARVWNRSAAEIEDLSDVDWIVWMTGDDSVNTLTSEDRELLSNYIFAQDGPLLISGQNITEDEQTGLFVRGWMGCDVERHDTDRPRAWGVSSDSNLDDEFLVLVGTTGANNQTSPSSVWPIDWGYAILVNDTNDNEVCGVANEQPSRRNIFLSFGIEAISGLASSTSRAEFLELCRQWLMRESDTPPFAPLPSAFTLSPAFPNPFNSSTSFNWTSPASAPVTITVFDVLGRQVEILHNGLANAGYHRTMWDASSVASGNYFIRLATPNQTISRAVRLVK